MTETYLDMMETSLVKKIEVMKQIEEQNIRQKEALMMPDGPDEDTFDDAVHIKGDLIDKLTDLNEGFAGLYDKVKTELGQSKDKYKDQIMRLQDLIRAVTDLSNTLEIQETRNKELINNSFYNMKKELEKAKRSSDVVYSYRSLMKKSGDDHPHFFDDIG